MVIAPLKAQITEQVAKANTLFKTAGSTATAVELSGDDDHEHRDVLKKLQRRKDIRLIYSASLIA